MKYVIFIASGGLAHMLAGLSYSIDVALKHRRKLIFDTAKHSAFGHKFTDIFNLKVPNLKYSENYANIPRGLKYEGLSVDLIKNTNPKYISGKYILLGHNISRRFNAKDNKKSIYLYCSYKGNLKYLKYISLKKNIIANILKEPKIPKPYISVHFRNTDKKHNIAEFLSAIRKQLSKDKGKHIKDLYLASDDYHAFNKFKNVFKNLKIHRYTVPKPGIRNLHYDKSIDKYVQLYECFRDMYFILASDYFVPSKWSGLSRLLLKMIKDNSNFFHLNYNPYLLRN